MPMKRERGGRRRGRNAAQSSRPWRLKSPGERKLNAQIEYQDDQRGGRITTYARQMTQQRGSTPLMQRPCRDGVTAKVRAQSRQQHQQDATSKERNGEHACVICGRCSEGSVLTVMTRRRGITPVDALTRATKWHRCAVSNTWLGICSSSARRTTSCPLSSSSLHSKLTAKPQH